MKSSNPLSFLVISVRCAAEDQNRPSRHKGDGVLTPRTRVRDIQMISALLGRELGVRLFGDPVAEDRGLALELAGFIVRVNPVGDFAGGVCCL